MEDEREWSERLRSVSISKATMNALVMNYLIVEGHKEAAERFQQESGTPAGNLDTIADRRALRVAIETGDIPAALARAGQVLSDASPDLNFAIRQQQLIELIRRDDVDAAVAFAQEKLAPQAEQSSSLLSELERTMLLLAFDDPNAAPDGAELLSQARRRKTASLLNAAVLASQSHEKEAALPMMLRRLQWAQDELLQRQRVSFPRIDDIFEALPRPTEPPMSEPAEADVAMPEGDVGE